MEDISKVVAFIDGGSRGNPGPSASAFALSINDEHVTTRAKFLGTQTNNVAEYRALELLVDYLVKHPPIANRRVDIYCDSKLVVSQMRGLWRVKDPNLDQIKREIEQKMRDASLWTWLHHIPRAKNKEADKGVNNLLDMPIRPDVVEWDRPQSCLPSEWRTKNLVQLVDIRKGITW